MILKNKYLPLQNTELNYLQLEYLIENINYWIYLMIKSYSYDIRHQSFLKWFSKRKNIKLLKNNIIAEQLSTILDNLEEAQFFNENAVLNNDDLELINRVYKKMRFSLICIKD